MRTVDSDDPREHLKAGHRVQAQWTVWTSQNVKLDEDGTLVVLTDTQRILDDTEGSTEWWCSECDQLGRVMGSYTFGVEHETGDERR